MNWAPFSEGLVLAAAIAGCGSRTGLISGPILEADSGEAASDGGPLGASADAASDACIPVQGAAPVVLASGMHISPGLVVDSTSVYFGFGDPLPNGLAKFGGILKMPVGGGAVSTLATSHLPIAVAADNANLYWVTTDDTVYSDCSVMKVPLGGGTPVTLAYWLLQATLTVPISDYFLRLTQSYSAATHSRDAARFDAAAAKANAAADGRVAYYTWLGSRGSVIVAVQALNDQRSHLVLAKNLFDAGQASKSDVLRAGTNVTSAELQVVHAKNLADLAEKQMRVAMHAKDEELLVPGESLEVNPPPITGNVRAFIDEALVSRMEVRSIDANAKAADDQAKAAFATQLPVVTGVGDLIYANPNSRLFPPEQEWFPTWDLGVRVTWSPNDTFVGGYNVDDLKARAAQLAAQKGTLRDNVEIEVTQAYNNARESDASLESAKIELESAEEAYRVTKELFNNGRATSTTLTDSETELTRSRLDLLTARVSA